MRTETQRTLPPPLTSFVGRDDDLSAIDRRLGPGRLLTLTGAGGSGKTRLAVEAARTRFAEDGGALVMLAAVQDPALVPSAVARAVGLREEPGRALDDLVVDHLDDHPLVLLLDNCEHVVNGVRPLVQRLLTEARGVTLLATSRTPLRIHGEHTWSVAPLAVPEQTDDPEAVTASPAGQLFLDRVRQARPDFVVTGDNATAVAALCRQLGGLPLAIELIAPWARVLGVEEMDARVGDLLRLPATSTDNARHRSIEAALDWSLELLAAPQQVLFRRLAVFAGGFSLDAAEAVAGPGAHVVLPDLAELVDHGLVVADVRGSARTRYRMLEPVRQHAAQLLEVSGEATAARLAHLQFFVGLAEEAAPHLLRADQVHWLSRIDEDLDNLRVAHDWASSAGQTELALRLVGALAGYWLLRGHSQEAAQRLEGALEASDDRGVARAKALLGLGRYPLLTGDYDRAQRLYEESVDLYRSSGHRPGLARALGMLARLESNRGNVEAGERLALQALEVYRALGNDGGAAWILLVLTHAAGVRGDRARHQELVLEARPLFAALGDRWGLGCTDVLEAADQLIDGDPARIKVLADRALAGFAEIGNEDETAVLGHAVRAFALLRLGDTAGAREDAGEAVVLGQRTADMKALAFALTAAAEVLLASGCPTEAAELCGAAAVRWTVRSYIGAHVTETVMAALRDRLDEAALAGALERGRRRPPQDVLGLLSATAETIPQAPASSGPATAELIREGEYWTVGLGAESTRVRDRKGLRYLAHLLAHPGREFHVLDLVGAVEGVPAAQMDRGDTGPLLDPQAKAAYRDRLRDLEEELEEAESFGDGMRVERARGEREALVQQLAGAVGLGGRDRRPGSASERARVNITRLISTAVRTLEGDCPSLAHLLRSTVRTGTYCAYEPPPDGGPSWSLSPMRGDRQLKG